MKKGEEKNNREEWPRSLRGEDEETAGGEERTQGK